MITMHINQQSGDGRKVHGDYILWKPNWDMWSDNGENVLICVLL